MLDCLQILLLKIFSVLILPQKKYKFSLKVSFRTQNTHRLFRSFDTKVYACVLSKNFRNFGWNNCLIMAATEVERVFAFKSFVFCRTVCVFVTYVWCVLLTRKKTLELEWIWYFLGFSGLLLLWELSVFPKGISHTQPKLPSPAGDRLWYCFVSTTAKDVLEQKNIWIGRFEHYKRKSFDMCWFWK